MGKIINHKWIDELPEGAFPVKSGNDTAFAVVDEGTGVFLYIKVYRSHKQENGKNFKVVRICLTDVLRQIWGGITDPERRKQIKDMVTEL